MISSQKRVVAHMSKKTIKSDWQDTPEGREKYTKVKTEAQTMANEYGFDFGLEWNNCLKDYRSFMLPQRQNRRGYELRCEVVMCSDLSKCKPGHGPLA